MRRNDSFFLEKYREIFNTENLSGWERLTLAVNICIEGLNEFPNSLALKNRLAFCHVQMKDFESAKVILDKILERDVNNTFALSTYAKFYLYKKDYDMALNMAHRVSRTGDEKSGLSLQCDIYLANKDFVQLKETVENLESLGYTAVSEKYAKRLRIENDKNNTINNFRKAVFNDPFFTSRYLDIEGVNNYIAKSIQSNNGFLVGRCGRVEGLTVQKCLFDNNIDTEFMKTSRFHSGVTPIEDKVFHDFSKVYLEANNSMDLAGLVSRFENQVEFARLANCEKFTLLPLISPYRMLIEKGQESINNVWTQSLQGKKVLVIHPFISSLEQQFNNKGDILTVNKLLPEFSATFLAPPQTSANNHQDSNWLDEFSKLKQKVVSIDFDLAIIGAGSYGLPIGAFIKNKLKKGALVLGGDVQVLFGVIGARWEKEYFNTGIADKTWIRPSKLETPPDGHKVEGGCYY